MTTYKIVSAICRERKLMENENMDMTTTDTVTPTAAEDAAIQQEPPALVKKIGK